MEHQIALMMQERRPKVNELLTKPEVLLPGTLLVYVLLLLRNLRKSKAKAAQLKIERDVEKIKNEVNDSSLDDLVNRANQRRKRRRR